MHSQKFSNNFKVLKLTSYLNLIMNLKIILKYKFRIVS